MPEFSVPYGRGNLSFYLPEWANAEIVEPPTVPAARDPLSVVEAALQSPGADLARFRGARSAAIAINDKTRPVPHHHLLPPLLRQLENLGLPPEEIHLWIATGSHAPMVSDEFGAVVPVDLLARHPVHCHDADDSTNLVFLGKSSRGTPIWVNQHYMAADLRIVVGNLEPHQFQGFSGGAKSAAIGLAGRETIDRNHAMMLDPRAQLGRYADNPVRLDTEEIGRAIGVHLALNAILNGPREIVHAFAGEPRAVMEAGIPLSREVCQVAVPAPFDLVIASAGGHPKDLNFYQSQKALAHARPVVREGGTLILVASCPEGIGSPRYEAAMAGMRSFADVMARFEREEFHVGAHKAYLIARDAAGLRTFLVSEMPPTKVRSLLLTPVAGIDKALASAGLADAEGVTSRSWEGRVGIIPRASSTIARLDTVGSGRQPGVEGAPDAQE